MHPYLGAVQHEDEVRVVVGDQRRLVEPGRCVAGSANPQHNLTPRVPRLYQRVGLCGLFDGQDVLYLHAELAGIEHLRELLQLTPLCPRAEGVVDNPSARLGLLTEGYYRDHATPVAHGLKTAPEGFSTDAIEDGVHAIRREVSYGGHPVSMVVDRFGGT